MIARPIHELCPRIKRARKHFNLQVQQMAMELRICPEWLSKILGGHQPASYSLGLRFEDFLRRRGLDATAFASDDAVLKMRPAGGGHEALRKRIDEEYRLLLASAGDDVERLEAIALRMASLRLPSRKRTEVSPVVRSKETEHRPARLRRKSASSRVVSVESPSRNEGNSVAVPRQCDRRDFIAQRYEALAQGKGRVA